MERRVNPKKQPSNDTITYIALESSSKTSELLVERYCNLDMRRITGGQLLRAKETLVDADEC